MTSSISCSSFKQNDDNDLDFCLQLETSASTQSWLRKVCTNISTVIKSLFLNFFSKFILNKLFSNIESQKCSGNNTVHLKMEKSENIDLLDHWNVDQSEITNDDYGIFYELSLNSFNKNKLFRCKKNNRICFALGPSLYSRKIILKTNFNNEYTNFDRKKYIEMEISNNLNSIQLCSSGSFHFFYFEKNSPNIVLGSFYVLVDPNLEILDPKTKILKTLPINAVQCQTVLSKLMGSIDTWKVKLKVSIESHYNMIHWTPIQKLGASNSAYSLADQHQVNQNFCSDSMKELKQDCKLEDVQQIVKWLFDENGVLSVTDIVLNHTANESPWLKEHPESAFNCVNSPWLRPAFLLDRLLLKLTLDIEDGLWINEKISSQNVSSNQHLETIKHIFTSKYLPTIKLEEFYLCDAKSIIEQFTKFFSCSNIGNEKQLEEIELSILQDPTYHRLGSTIDMKNALKYVMNKIEKKDFSQKEKLIKTAITVLKKKIDELNQQKRLEIENFLDQAVENVWNGARYERLNSNGPKLTKLTKSTPFTTQYFIDQINLDKINDLTQIENSLYDENISCFYMAHNGWVMGDDPLKNFAEKDSWVYFRRELVCWGDSVKLRYGNKPEDSPYLWSHFEKYVTQMAHTFHGFRLDNCHSTPIHVAQHMLDAARRINSNLYLVAELFTANESIDNIFVNKLGINSLVREAMSSFTPYELQRQIYRFGGEPVGSFSPDAVKFNDRISNLNIRPSKPSVAHAIFFDQTHDNESPIIRRTVYDILPTSALVSITYSATGSNRGLDELVPHHIHVVNESREYSHWDECNQASNSINLNYGIINQKRILNQLHYLLNSSEYSQSFVDQRDRDTIVVTRHNPINHQSVIMIARTAFYPLDQGYSAYLAPLEIEGEFQKILFEMKMSGQFEEPFEKNSKFINGFNKISGTHKLIVDLKNTDMIELKKSSNNTNLIQLKSFPPSSVLAIKFGLLENQKIAVEKLNEFVNQFSQADSDIVKIVRQLNLFDMNYILFRCNQEENDENWNGTYHLSTGQFVYCGLASVMFLLARIRTLNDLGHPLCTNLRDGNWLPRYIVDRLKKRSGSFNLSLWLEEVFEFLSLLPRYLIPSYFDSILSPLYALLLEHIWNLSSDFVRHGDNFVKRVAFGGVALISHQPSFYFPPLNSESLPKNFYFENELFLPSMAAGLPHFSCGYMRNWGRDTFISLKGLCLLTGRCDEAKAIILMFGGTMRHGLIPNLLDGGRKPRYNCRDAVWWWLQAIKEYIQIVPNGKHILNEKVTRIFPTDDSLNDDPNKVRIEPLHKTMQEALESHFQGINFVERNAGFEIDEHMISEGFSINVGLNRDTGFIFGGNQWNCGTWMDKMGSSEKAGNRGKPATPRDGSAVEIVGLSYSVIRFLQVLSEKNIYPYREVSSIKPDGSIESWTFEAWSLKIQQNFEKFYYIGENCADKHTNRRKIYKDSVNATFSWMDYQLRPNFLITMVVASDLFDNHHAMEALNIVEDVLLGPLGLKTLDPNDWTFRGDYENSDDSNDFNVAHGYNYHNGPEWLWLMGYYLMARLKFTSNQDNEIMKTNQILAKHFENLIQSEWFGLPELTNSDGSFCSHSCSIQAWSHATILEVLHMKYILKMEFLSD